MRDIVIPDFLGAIGGEPKMDFHWKEVAGKRRLLGNPNKAMRVLHEQFGWHIKSAIRDLQEDVNYGIRRLPSATGCVPSSNPTKNALRHAKGKFFYVTDLKDAYPSIDLERLALFLTFLFHYKEHAIGGNVSLKFFMWSDGHDRIRQDPLFGQLLTLLQCHFSGLHGKGLAIGGPLSPYLMNLYCEVYLDSQLRPWCTKRGITYTRYVDDLVFSSETAYIREDQRKKIREFINAAGFRPNHRKSKVLVLRRGTVFITKVGLESRSDHATARLVFPQRKRRRLRNAIMDYLTWQTDWPEKVSGLVAEFLYHYKNVGTGRTASDKKLFALCWAFEAEWSKYRKGPRPGARMKN
jgi:hypothetical protein